MVLHFVHLLNLVELLSIIILTSYLKGHILEPYIHLGIESIEYNSEIDTDGDDMF